MNRSNNILLKQNSIMLEIALIAITVLLAVLPCNATYAQSVYGTLTGRVLDELSGDILPSVKIELIGTDYSITTNFKGDFSFIAIPAGKYSIKATAIGFNSLTIQDIKISSSIETTLDIKLSPAPFESKREVIVIATQHETGKLSTGTVHIVDKDDIMKYPGETVLDIMNILPGISDQSIVRGGRATEIDYQIDGVSIRDPLFGGLDESALISNSALKEIQIYTGGSDARFGNALSGVVNMITKEGGDRWTSSFNMKSSFAALNGSSGESKLNSRGERLLDISAGGPLSYGVRKVKLFLNGRVNIQENRTPGLKVFDPEGNNITDFKHNSMNKAQLYAKISLPLSSNTKIKAAGFFSNNNYEEDSWQWRYNLTENALPVVSQQNKTAYLRLSHSFSENLFTEVSYEFMNRNFGRGLRDSRHSFNWLTNYHIDDDPENAVTPIYDARNPYGVNGVFINEGALSSAWNNASRYNALNLRVLWQAINIATITFGAETKKHSVSNSYTGNSYESINSLYGQYQYNPISYGGFVNASVNLWKLRLDTGLRAYYLDSKAPEMLNSYLKDAESLNVNPKMRVSPRFGLSYQINNDLTTYANIGTYYQNTTFHSLYSGMEGAEEQYGSSIAGNPNLDFQRSRFIEVGFTFWLKDLMKFDIGAYSKQLEDLENISVVSYLSQYSNSGKSDVNGIELSLTRRRADDYRISMSYAYSHAKGSLSLLSPNMPFKIASDISSQSLYEISSDANDTKDYYMQTDRRHSFRLVADFKTPKSFGPEIIYGLQPLQNISALLTLVAASGTPYTVINENNIIIGDINEYRNPAYVNSNIRFSKSFPYNKYNFELYFDIRNLFNRAAPLKSYTLTGSTDQPGEIIPDFPLNPGIGMLPPESGRLFNAAADLDGNGELSANEQQEAYNRFLNDYVKLQTLYQKPREVWIGIKFGF